MKSNETAAGSTPAAPPEISATDQAFELEIITRNPKRRIARFDFPSEVEDARAVYMFELKGRDTITVGEMTDAIMTDSERKNQLRAMEAEQREAIRFSILGLITDTGACRHVDQGAPLMELDDWSGRAWTALRAFFGEMNGLPNEELGKALRGARRLGAASARLPAG